MARLTYRSLLLSTVLSIAHVTSGAALNQETESQRPEEHLCPITCVVMKDPVVASDGRSYEREAIVEWIKTKGISPFTRERLSIELHPNQALRTIIGEWRPEAQGRQSMLAEMSPDEILKAVREEFAKNNALLASEHTARDKDIVVFIGNTGAGKSTLINFLAGKSLQVVGQRYALVNSEDSEAMPIGNRMFNSETLYPKSIDIDAGESGTLRFFDLPGLNDTDGSVRNLVNAAFVRQILLDARTIRFVYVAGQDQFTADRGQSVQQTVAAISNLFVTASNPSRPLDRGLFVVSKEDGLIEEIRNLTDATIPEQIRIWKNQGSIAGMYHTRLGEQNTREHQEKLLRRIASLEPQKLISINVSSLYPSNTRNDIERMYQRMYEGAYQNAERDRGETLTDIKRKMEMWKSDTFWDEFEAMYVYSQNPAIEVLKNLTIGSYSKVRRQYSEGQEARRIKHIESLQSLINEMIEKLKEGTITRATNIVKAILEEQAHKGVVPYDFGNQVEYWNRVCGPEALESITVDAAEQEIIRKVYIGWIGEHFQRQIQSQIENNRVIKGLQRRVDELSQHLQDRQSGLTIASASAEETARPVRALAAGGDRQDIVIPDIARGHEEVYRQFLRGKLVYKPDPNSDVGRKEFPIGDLANPLSETFNISDCGESAQHLSISTGFRTAFNSENANKIEVWIVPRFVIDKDPAAQALARELGGIGELAGQPVTVLFNWGGWSNVSWYEVAATGEDNLLDHPDFMAY